MTEIKNEIKSAEILQAIKDSRVYIVQNICTGCGLCGELCPFGLPKPNASGKYEIKDPDLCIECSACQRNCPTQAILLQEQKGCGCLWDARQRLKTEKTGKTSSSPCACGTASTSSCCGAPVSNANFDIKVLEAFNSFIKPNLNSCCAPPKEQLKKLEKEEKY